MVIELAGLFDSVIWPHPSGSGFSQFLGPAVFRVGFPVRMEAEFQTSQSQGQRSLVGCSPWGL